MLGKYRERREYVIAALRAIPGVTCAEPGGAFYAYPNISCTFGKGGIESPMDFAKKLLADAYVAVVPAEAFGTREQCPHFVRRFNGRFEARYRSDRQIHSRAFVTPLEPLKFNPRFKEKIWGSTNLAPIFGDIDRPIGEAWYTYEQNTVIGGSFDGRSIGSLLAEYGPRLMGSGYQASKLRRRSADPSAAADGAGKNPYFPILTKLLFPSQKLSVQVHPNDAYAIEHEDGPGKTEMGYVLAAKPDACIALGLTEDLSPSDLAASARSKEIEKYLRWVPVCAGQTVFVPPGTIHTLGEGVVICEIQQNSDLTYRFLRFRPRWR